MAQSIKELRQRITGVGNIQKITRAMEMVAATKLRRLQQRAEGSRPYADTIRKIATTLASGSSDASSPLTLRRETVKKVAILAVSSDRGLCGSYNANVFRQVKSSAAAVSESHPAAEIELFTLGKKARQHFARRMKIAQAFADDVEKLEYRRAADVSRQLSAAFEAGEYDEVHLVYTRFASVTRQLATAELLLPIDPKALAIDPSSQAGDASQQDESGSGAGVDLILEPDAAALLERLLPKSLAVRVFSAVLDALASEFAARRVAMKAATDAAGDMIKDLRREYNKARQSSITTELLDIVGGAEAL